MKINYENKNANVYTKPNANKMCVNKFNTGKYSVILG